MKTNTLFTLIAALLMLASATATAQNTITLTSSTGEITLSDGDILTGTGGTETHVSIAAGATVTLSNVDITSITNDDTHEWAGITCLGDAKIILADNTVNKVKCGYEDYPGIQAAESGTLSIEGGGTLEATSIYGSGIGSGYFHFSCGDITINGGIITATSERNSAGIGSGGGVSSCGNITINGGIITATSLRGAGIGSGESGSCEDIKINGGKITAKSSTSIDGIGCGLSLSTVVATCGTITLGYINDDDFISASSFAEGKVNIKDGQKFFTEDGTKIEGSNIDVSTINGKTLNPLTSDNQYNLKYAIISGIKTHYFYIGNEININPTVVDPEGNVLSSDDYTIQFSPATIREVGDYTFTITAAEGSQYTGTKTFNFIVRDGLTEDTKELTLYDGDILTGKGGPDTHIYIAAGATVTLSGVDITSIPDDDNHLWAGITCLGDATIILDDNTANKVTRGYCYYPGIQVAKNGTLTIEGNGALEVTGSFGAGIGSKDEGSCGDIVINGGIITAMSSDGAGIGSGWNGSCGNITINGGKITATGSDGAGIGGGYATSSCGDITINGGKITAKSNRGAGIGCGYKGSEGNSTCGTITLGYTNIDDFIKASSFSEGKVNIKDGQSFFTEDGTKIEGNNIDVSAINTRALYPSIAAYDLAVAKISGIKSYYFYTGDVISITPTVADLFEHALTDEDCTIQISPTTIKDKGNYTLTVTAVAGSQYTGTKIFNIAVGDGIPVTLTSETQKLTLSPGTILSGTGGADTHIIIEEGATVILNGVDITSIPNDQSHPWAGITCLGDATIILAENTVNKVSCGYRDYPAIQAAESGTLTIDGSGALEPINRDSDASAIGCSRDGSCGDIIINNGIISTEEGYNYIGTGWSDESSCGKITINGGKISALIIGNPNTPMKSGTITLGYTNEDDIIKAMLYTNGKVNIKEGQKFISEDGVEISGSNIDNSLINNKAIAPYINFDITYTLGDDAANHQDNPATYNFATPTITLQAPTRDHYEFAGWTGSNGETPQLEVSITKGSTGKKSYTAHWRKILTNANVADINARTYTGGDITPTVSVSDDGATLTLGTDYTVTYSENKNAGKATVIITGEGIYCGEVTKNFTINPKAISISWGKTTLTYNGAPQAPTATAGDLIGEDVCTITVTGAETNVGNNYTATASELSNKNYALPTENLEKAFAIEPKEITITWSDETTFTYNGAPHAPTATLSESLFGEDVCTITVSGAETNVGNNYTATATLSNDNYTLSSANKTTTFAIEPKTISITWSDETAFTYYGEPHAPTATLSESLFGEDVCTITITGVETNVGDNYTATASLSNDNYTLSTANKTKAFSIVPQTETIGAITFTTDENGTTAVIDGEYTGTDATTLPQGGIEVDKVTINRNFTSGAYSTIVLPFDAIFPDGMGTFYTFKGVKYNENSDSKWTAYVQETAYAPANTPFIFEPEGTVTQLSWNASSTKINLNTDKAPTTSVTDDYGDWTFTGTYQKKVFGEMPTDQTYYGFAGANEKGIAIGEFVHGTGNAFIRPFRCYLAFDDANGLSKSAVVLPSRIEVRVISSVIDPADPEENPNGDIETPTSELIKQNVNVWSFDKTIYIAAAPSTPYTIVDVNGRPLQTGITATDRDEIHLPGKVDGIVIVRVANQSFKIRY